MAGNFWNCFMATTVICLGSYFGVYNFVVCNNVTSIGLEWVSNISVNGTQSAVNLWSLFYTSFPVGLLLGALPSSMIAEKIGRRGGLLFTCPIAIIGSITTTISVHFNYFYVAIFGRILLGMATGISRTSATLWITEFAPTEKRGFFLAFEGVFYCIGDLVAYFVMLPYLLGNENRWAYSFLCSTILHSVLFFFFIYLPESPRHIFFNLSSQEKLHNSIRFYRGSANLDETLQQLERESHQESSNSLSWSQIFTSTVHRRMFLLSILILGTIYFDGISELLAYSTEMLEAANVSLYLAMHLTVAIGLIKLPIIFFPLIIERFGRRPLFIYSNVGCAVVGALLVLTYWADIPSAFTPWWTTILLFIQSYLQQLHEIMAFTVGAEILTPQSRAKGLAIGSIAVFSVGIFLTYVFLPMARNWGMAWAVAPYAVVPLLLAVIMWMFLPETRMRTFEEIAIELHKKDEDSRPLISSSTDPAEYGTSMLASTSRIY